MKIRRTAGLVAAAAAVVLALGACAPADNNGGGTATDSPGATEPAAEQHVTVGWNQSLYSMNNLTAQGNAAANANILYMTTSFFHAYNDDLELFNNEDFGTIEVIHDGQGSEPLTVKYTINEGVVWSDGVPVDAADLILTWGAQNDKFDQVGDADIEWDDDGNQVVPEDKVYFSSSSTIMNVVTQFPEIGDDGRSITMIHDRPVSDFMMAMSSPTPVAAHVVAQRALDIEDPQEAKQALITAFQDNDTTKLLPISQVWENDFNFTSLPDDPALYLSYGPFVIDEFVENQYIRLIRNEKFFANPWGPVPNVDSITVRFNEDPLAQVTALQNEELDLIAPQSTVDVLATLQGIDGITYFTDMEGTWEHLDLVVDNQGPFDPATYGGNADTARKVRTAFLMTVPRPQIIETLIRPLQEDAQMRNSFLYVPGAPGYDETVAANGSDAFAEQNIEGAKALLEEAGVDLPVDVRMLYGASNVRRANQFQLIQAAAPELFNLIDEGDDMWGARLTDTASYDVALFGWQSTNTMLLNSQANYITGGMNNFYGWSDPQMDEAWDRIAVSTDDAANLEDGKIVEQIIWEQGWSMPIFQFPGVTAHTERLQNVSTIAISPTI
ncbi:MAG: ABC transporter substrate-binding protein, partial [Cellulomonadaceae bacterium]|nr:ABC transporter substrate-binding protein [Cellulomonadaceae bacterium]